MTRIHYGWGMANKNGLNTWEATAYFMLLEKSLKKEGKKSELIKTKVEELGFMDILPKVQALGHNSGSFWELLLKVLWTA